MTTFLGRGFRLHFEDRGQGDPVVFLPGYLMDSHLFDEQVAALQGTYRCVVLDRRGHGHCNCPPGPWSIDDLVDDAIGLIEHLDLGPCHLVGMSLGGVEITRIALREPKLVRSHLRRRTCRSSLPAGATFDIEDIAAHGLSDGLIELAAQMLYGEKFRASHPDLVAAGVARMRELPRATFVEGFRINMTTEPGAFCHHRATATIEIAAAPTAAGRQACHYIPQTLPRAMRLRKCRSAP